MNIADKIREYQRWHKMLEANYTRLAEDKTSDLSDEIADDLAAAGVLVFVDWWYCPQLDGEERIQAMDLDDEDKATIHDYVGENWNESIGWRNSIKEVGIKRATAAWKKKVTAEGLVFNQPDHDLSTVEEYGGYMWVVLRNADDEELARYVVVDAPPAQVKDDDPGTWWRLRHVEPEQFDHYREKVEAAE